jgi:chemotaxis protein methyltransferase CheR
MNKTFLKAVDKKELIRVRNIISAEFGLFFSSRDLHILENRLTPCLERLGVDTFNDYAEVLLRPGNKELQLAIEHLTNNETYLFREDYQLAAFSKEMLPLLKKKASNNRQLTIWSAGCSSGEEVYTIAMLLADSGLFTGWNVRILGTDIHSAMISHARKGLYSESSFRNTSSAQRRRHFTRKGHLFEIKDDIKAMCNFSTMNILNDDSLGIIGRFDVVFCRNVLMYFDKKSKLKCLSNFFNRLQTGGMLLLGHTESLLNLKTDFEDVYLTDALVYRKPEGFYE